MRTKLGLLVILYPWLAGAVLQPARGATTAELLAERETYREEIRRLNTDVEDLQRVNVSLQKRLNELENHLREIRSEVSRGKENQVAFASQADFRRLADQVQQVDKNREEDKRLILRELEKLAKLPPVIHDPPPKAPKSKPKAAPAPAAEEGYEYEVKPGDNLSKISALYAKEGIKVTVDQILKANPGLKPEKLSPGKKIFIPAARKSGGN